MKSIVLVSGGMDSAVALALAKQDNPDEVIALSIYYGSKHEDAEMSSARAIAHYYDCVQEFITLPYGIFAEHPALLKQKG